MSIHRAKKKNSIQNVSYSTCRVYSMRIVSVLYCIPYTWIMYSTQYHLLAGDDDDVVESVSSVTRGMITVSTLV